MRSTTLRSSTVRGCDAVICGVRNFFAEKWPGIADPQPDVKHPSPRDKLAEEPSVARRARLVPRGNELPSAGQRPHDAGVQRALANRLLRRQRVCAGVPDERVQAPHRAHRTVGTRCCRLRRNDRFRPDAESKILWSPTAPSRPRVTVCSPPSRRVAALRFRYGGCRP